MWAKIFQLTCMHPASQGLSDVYVRKPFPSIYVGGGLSQHYMIGASLVDGFYCADMAFTRLCPLIHHI
jgi:hypothetical protein